MERSIHDTLNAARQAQPFEPFTIVSTAGTRITVRHPDLIIVGSRIVQVQERKIVSGEQVEVGHTIQVRNISHIEESQDNGTQEAA